jgi:hypothetical protein
VDGLAVFIASEGQKMADVYVLGEQGESKLMTRIHCKAEGEELQRVLELNPNLLPGNQIDPDDPRRWLLIKREMPVPDPNTGGDRWSIDFFFVDQSGIPTFVECKRFKDTRSRREVVGQMLEYAANGQHYWTKDMIRAYAEESVRIKEQTLEAELQMLGPDPDIDEQVDGFFDRVMNNLREGQVRLIFFLEEAPAELVSIVDFLNKQMERSEVLLVEVRQYTDGKMRVAAPALYGYTEEAHQIKKTVTVTNAVHRKWDETSFFDEAQRQLSKKTTGVNILRKVFDYAKSSRYAIKWGKGKDRGSFGLKNDAICPRTVITIWTDGTLNLNFGWCNGSEVAEAFRDEFKRDVQEKMLLSIPDDYQSTFPGFPIETWGNTSESLTAILDGLLSRWAVR